VISTVLYGLGLVLVIEGLVYVLAPHFVEKMLVSLKEMPNEQRRLVGACMALLGGLILLLIKTF
jgi:uncharacterized protein YjeT (DUF2065 family)